MVCVNGAIGAARFPVPPRDRESVSLKLNEHTRLSFFHVDCQPVAGYPSDVIQKGLVLLHDGESLAEEGVGFGVPILKYGHEAVFPGAARITLENDGDSPVLTVAYEMDLVQRMTFKGRGITWPPFYRGKEIFSFMHRRYRFLRGVISRISAGMRSCGLQSSFVRTEPAGEVPVTYRFDVRHGKVNVAANFSCIRREGCSEIIMANEQGAAHFERYRDADGVMVTGKTIGTWEEIAPRHAIFIDPHRSIAFALDRAEGARLFRGWEMKKGRLAWAGLNHVLPRDATDFTYEIRMGTV